MHLLLGIGNRMNGDDAIGVWIAHHFSCKGWASIDCATVPENCMAEIRRHHAEKIVIVDAADMGLNAGDIRIIPKEKIGVASFSTHSVPLSVFYFTSARIEFEGHSFNRHSAKGILW